MNISNPTKGKVEEFLNYIFHKTDIILNGPDNKLWTIAEAYSKDKKDQYGQLDLGIKEKKISGIDIPILLGDGNSYEKKPIVAIVAQDPYRNEKDVLFNEIDKSKTIIGTPFAFHYEEEAYPKTRVYRNIVRRIIKMGYDVYLTDAHKIYSNPERKFAKGEKQKEKELLLDEINELSPNLKLVVGFGGEAYTYIKKIKDSISLLHPSQSNWDHWRLWIYEQAYNKKQSYKINWEQYANKLTIRDSMFGSENKDNLEDIISDIILDIIQQELKEKE